ncbi:MAG: HlyC/CorC family transporter [Bacteroidia bacterium]|nr:HlyC/CorC family transporter [Bacteroidia bacterium]
MSATWIYICSAVAASAFFSGMEIAFLTANKLKIELSTKQGGLNAGIISYFVRKPAHFIATMLVGNSIALVIFSIFMETVLFGYFGRWISHDLLNLVLTTLISTLIILVAAEYIPKSLFRINPNGLLSVFAVPLMIIYWILSPIVFISLFISNQLLKRMAGVEVTETETSFGRVDLDNLVRETVGQKDLSGMDHEVTIFRNALDFSEVKVRECMVPRTEIVAVEANSPVSKLRQKFIDTRLSKILVFDGTVDQLVGYIHSHELFRHPETLRSVLLPLIIVPESMPARDALTLFIQQRKSMAVVVDEFGVTAGILTMEDVMEEIFGEIEDEHDKEELTDRKISEREFLFSGRIEVDHLNQKYSFDLEKEEEYETLSGFILHHHQSVPRQGEVIRIGTYTFTITNVTRGRIELVNVKRDE